MAVDKFELGLALLWTAFGIYFLLSLFPPFLWVYQRWESKLKGTSRKAIRSPSWLQRFVFVWLVSVMVGQLYARAFHRDFGQITGIDGRTICLLMVLLPALYFLLPVIERHFQGKH